MGTEPRPRLVILGAGRFAMEVAELVSEAGLYEVVAFAVNQNREQCGQTIMGKPVLWVDELADLAPSHHALCAIGTTRRLTFTEHVERLGFRFATLIHPTAHVMGSATVGEGTTVSLGVMVGASSSIGRHVIINRGVLIGHHTRIGDHATISPGANIAGGVTIGSATFIGMGATILEGLTVGSHSVIGAGSVVTRDIGDNVLAIGYPASIAQEGIEGL